VVVKVAVSGPDWLRRRHEPLPTLLLPGPAELRRRLPFLVGGLSVIAVGTSLMVRAGLGLSPYEVLNDGISRVTPLTIGQAGIAVGVLVMLGWIPLRQRPGLGTLVNVFATGLMIDAMLLVLPVPELLVTRVAWMVAGTVGVGLGIGLYIGAGLGPGPRDGLMTGLADRGAPIWLARFGLEAVSLVVGWRLGGTVGVGTVAFAVSVPFLIQYSRRWTVAPAPVAGVADGRA
jgi:uncharacterized membrane protein YczE